MCVHTAQLYYVCFRESKWMKKNGRNRNSQSTIRDIIHTCVWAPWNISSTSFDKIKIRNHNVCEWYTRRFRVTNGITQRT